jgi:hypothetical protein
LLDHNSDWDRVPWSDEVEVAVTEHYHWQVDTKSGNIRLKCHPVFTSTERHYAVIRTLQQGVEHREGCFASLAVWRKEVEHAVARVDELDRLPRHGLLANEKWPCWRDGAYHRYQVRPLDPPPQLLSLPL